MSDAKQGAKPRHGLVLAAAAVAALVGGSLGCEAREFGPERQRAEDSQRAALQASGPVDPRAARIGPFGYQSGGLQHSNTGGGSMVSVGLPARGGGPVVGQDCDPRGLAVGEHIGTPQNDGTERVIVDPVTAQPVVYSQRHHGVASRFEACGLSDVRATPTQP